MEDKVSYLLIVDVSGIGEVITTFAYHTIPSVRMYARSLFGPALHLRKFAIREATQMDGLHLTERATDVLKFLLLYTRCWKCIRFALPSMKVAGDVAANVPIIVQGCWY